MPALCGCARWMRSSLPAPSTPTRLACRRAGAGTLGRVAYERLGRSRAKSTNYRRAMTLRHPRELLRGTMRHRAFGVGPTPTVLLMTITTSARRNERFLQPRLSELAGASASCSGRAATGCAPDSHVWASGAPRPRPHATGISQRLFDRAEVCTDADLAYAGSSRIV